MTPDRRATMKRICRGCGCTDDHACIADDGPCSWVLFDIESASGICSACADHVEWDSQIMATHGLKPQHRGLVAR
jgi:hypothetical protein